MKSTRTLTKISFWRQFVQWGFLGWCLFLGIQFGLFVRHFETFGQTPEYLRPPGVEGFLPIGALVSLKHWLLNGQFDRLHPAALVLFVTFLAMAFLAKKSFCSWLCPVGTLSEGLWKLGRRLLGRNYRIWRPLDLLLQGLKYTLLLFFAKTILLDMPAAALQGFLSSPYWAIADVRMLHFFTDPSPTSLLVISLLVLASVFLRNFWCRYLCPYGALLGLISFLSPLKIRRDEMYCTSCQACTKACPSDIPVHSRATVRSPECTGCLTCTSSCPEAGALAMRLPVWRRPLPAWTFAVIVLLIFTAGVGTGMISGHWTTTLQESDFQRLIPLAAQLGH